MSYTVREAPIPLLPYWLNLDSCSIIRLATVVLSLCIAVYLLSRRGKSRATLLLGLTFCGAALFQFFSLLEFAGTWYWQPRNLKNLLVPLLQDTAPSLAFLPLIAFTYFFPRLPRSQERECRWVLGAVILADSALLALTVYNHVFLERLRSDFRLTMTYYTLLYASVGMKVVLVVTLLLRRAVLLSGGKGRRWWARLLRPHGKDARAARSLALILLLVVAAVCGYVFLTYGLLPLPVATYLIWLVFLLYDFGFVVAYLNHTSEPSSIQVKLVGLTLVPVLGILGLVALLTGRATETDYSTYGRIPNQQTVLFTPNRLAGYDIRAGPLTFDADLGQKLEVRYGGSQRVWLGFAFPFFDRRYRVIQVLHCPLIYLGDMIEEEGWGGYRPNAAIAPLLINLDPSSGGGIFVKASAETLTVTWYRLPELGLANANTVQLALSGDGSIRMSFAQVEPRGSYQAVQMYDFWTATTTGQHPGSKGKAVAFGPRLTGIHPGLPDAPLKELRFAADLPISLEGRQVIFESYEAGYQHYLHARMSLLAVILIAATLFIVFVFPALFRTNLVRPLQALEQGMSRAEAGDLEASVAPRFHDEIGFLTRSFNRMLQAIQRAETGFWMLAENAQDGIMILRKGKPAYVNRRACEITGYTKAELLASEFSRLVSPGPLPPGPEPAEVLLSSKAGPGIPIELGFSQTVWRGQPAEVVILRDITERRSREEKARQAQQRLLQADKLTSLGVLLAEMAHEINNPNQTILANASLLARACPDIVAMLDQYRLSEGGFLIGGLNREEFRELFPRLLEDIQSCAKRIEGIIRNLRSFAREDPFPVMSRLDLNEVVRSAVELAASNLRRATERFSLQLSPDLPSVNGNPQRLEQVVINLLLNACQALPSRSRGISVATACAGDRRQVFVEVRDEGNGISADHLDRLGEPFLTTRRASGGTGLGLYVARTILAEHGGSLGFSSRPGKGTRATVTLPAEA
jgi:signal transduction histidine kinase/HAMP domain-containing protein